MNALLIYSNENRVYMIQSELNIDKKYKFKI